GGRFTITATGQCAAASSIAVVDGNGATVTVTVSNKLASVLAAPPDFAVSPTSVRLTSCSAVGNVALTGGTGKYFAASGDDAVTVDLPTGSSLASIRRAVGTGAAPPASVVVTFTDGKTAKTV